MIGNSTRKAWYRSSLGLFLGLKEGIVFICDELSQMCRMYGIFTCILSQIMVRPETLTWNLNFDLFEKEHHMNQTCIFWASKR